MATSDSNVADSAIEFIPARLFFYVTDPDGTLPSNWQPRPQFITCDETLVFTSFFADYGPFDLGKTVSFCRQLDELLKTQANTPCVLYCSDHPHRRSNAATLLCAYMIFCRNASVEEAYGPFIGIEPPFIPFRDAAFAINTFPCTVLDCCRAMRRAVSNNHFRMAKFSVRTFVDMAKLENGDLSWIIPNKFLAFSGPIAKKRKLAHGVYTLSPAEYVPILKSLGVTCIVRFNSKCYDKKVFVNAGMRFVDLLYDDGANPPEAVLQGFLQVCERERGVIAVHCKAGLGRTGTNISAYMMKHYGYTARECVAWCRLCRPGSVVGPQQHYLVSIEARMKAEGEAFSKKEETSRNLIKMVGSGNALESPDRSRLSGSRFDPIGKTKSSSGSLSPSLVRMRADSSGTGSLTSSRPSTSSCRTSTTSNGTPSSVEYLDEDADNANNTAVGGSQAFVKLPSSPNARGSGGFNSGVKGARPNTVGTAETAMARLSVKQQQQRSRNGKG